jgi:hypothetical protein
MAGLIHELTQAHNVAMATKDKVVLVATRDELPDLFVHASGSVTCRDKCLFDVETLCLLLAHPEGWRGSDLHY